MSFPIADWQFWIVTLTAAGSVWALVRPFLPGGKSDESSAPCSHCGAAPGAPCGKDADDAPRLVTLGDRRH
ncbi:MAG: hypothetical protein PVG07_02315 [Acidobacteriota bacterium]|jgi:hypothetical protein